MRRLATFLLPIALAIVACKSNSNDSPNATPSATQSAASAPASAAAPAPRTPPPTREGSALVRAAKDDALYLADEDHGVVRRIPLPLAHNPPHPFTTIPMPGLPAQVLALEDRVLVTIRSEGGTPPSLPKSDDDTAPAAAGSAAASAAKPPTKPPAKKNNKKPPPIPVSPTGPGLLLIMKPDPAAGLVEVARVALPADAWGIAVTPDEKTALVSSAWTHQVSAIDLATAKTTWTLDVRREPRAIVIRPDGKTAYVTHLVGGMITRIDDITAQPKATPVSLPPSPLRSPSGKTLDGTLAYSAVLSPNGERLFVPRHAIGALGEASWFGAATIDVLLTANDTPLAPKRDVGSPRTEADLTARMREAQPREAQTRAPHADFKPFSVPRAAIFRKKSSTLLVVSEGTNRVVEFDARVVDPTMFVRGSTRLGGKNDTLVPTPNSCSAPSGIALSESEALAWVYCRASNNIVQVRLEEDKADEDTPAQPLSPAAQTPVEGPTPKLVRVALEADLLGDDYNKGRRIFYDGFDDSISGGLSCAGCHPEGRDDGHVWHEATIMAFGQESTNFLGDGDQAPQDSTKSVGYARQTPMLAGRVNASGPYGWHGESPDLVGRLRAGFDLHRWGRLWHDSSESHLIGRAQFLSPFLRRGLVPPPREVHEMTPEEKRGKELFMSEETRCARCHVPETEYTDRTAYPLLPKTPTVTGFEDEAEQNFKTPSLSYVGGTAPYFHDGRASTLEVLIEQNGDRMGRTSQLSTEDRKALIAFLRTL